MNVTIQISRVTKEKKTKDLLPTKISEPHVGEFVSNHGGHALFVVGGGTAVVIEEVHFAVGDETPVLHGAGDEVRNGDHVWERNRNMASFWSTCNRARTLSHR